ncbi:DUF6252 family protein [Mucilaginibacter sp. McL0603]|uniref:DUF6252 family protein n=1 Tax=Mucilaginibacter sp. McL0603 TaxID=3415670 RepID=UPI003CEB755C
MRNLIFSILAFFSITFLSVSCKKQPVDQLSLLPPATQTGANTFGCLVNGYALIPHNRSIVTGPLLSCGYGLYSKGYLFNVTGGANVRSGNLATVSIQTDSLKISEGETVPLTKDYVPGYASGIYLENLQYHMTNDNARGQLTITHLDTINQIVSGTFYFNAVSANGDTVKITNGRFDMHYRQ